MFNKKYNFIISILIYIKNIYIAIKNYYYYFFNSKLNKKKIKNNKLFFFLNKT